MGPELGIACLMVTAQTMSVEYGMSPPGFSSPVSVHTFQRLQIVMIFKANNFHGCLNQVQ